MLTLLIIAAAQAVVPASLPARPAVSPEDKIVCQDAPLVETRILGKKVCLRQSQWDRIAKENQDDLESSRNGHSKP